jgi:predicted phage terminase large subunit-like protein
MAKTVQDYLNEVDYNFKGYVPSKDAIKFVNFIKLCEGGETENKSPVVHFKMLDNIFSRHKRHAIMCQRGLAKTTLMAEYLFLYIAVFGSIPNFGEVNLALYVADSAEGGAKNLRKNIEFRIEQSDFLKEYISNYKFTDNRLEFINKSNKRFIVKMYGGQQNIRGTKELGVRPQLAVLDDLLSDKDAMSPTILDDVENNITKAISKALHPTRSKIIYVGTPFNQNDPLYKRVESGKWNVSVYPICEKFPCSKEEFKGSWEDRFPYEYVKDEYEEAKAIGKLDAFYQELMLQIKNDEDRLIQDSEINFVEVDRKKEYNYYITTDFATSEKKASDYSVISIWAIDSKGIAYLVDGQAKRQTMDKNVIDLFAYARKYRPLQVGIEVTGQQKGFVSWVQKEMVNNNVYFVIKEVRPTNSKLQRFMDFLPLFKQGRIKFSESLNENFKDELYNELSNLTVKGFKSKHDDIADTLTMLIQMDVISSGSSANINTPEINYLEDLNYGEKKSEIDELFEYNVIDDSGYNSSYDTLFY